MHLPMADMLQEQIPQCVVSWTKILDWSHHQCDNKGLANTKRPCDCSVLCLHPKSPLCSCPYSILDMMSFGSTDSVHHVSMHIDATTTG